uniref:Uncharacterized protein n=1 Tax=Lysinibacillus sphaericus TaxID=1421 RepID=A0A6H0A1Y9_LYSSH|nr:hypothetical protein [Lysinibacillus sphaericus]
MPHFLNNHKKDCLFMTKQYIASIKNTTTGSWLKSTNSHNNTTSSGIIHSYDHTLLKEERLIFKDKNVAESTLKTLQVNYPDIFILVNETI